MLTLLGGMRYVRGADAVFKVAAGKTAKFALGFIRILERLLREDNGKEVLPYLSKPGLEAVPILLGLCEEYPKQREVYTRTLFLFYTYVVPCFFVCLCVCVRVVVIESLFGLQPHSHPHIYTRTLGSPR